MEITVQGRDTPVPVVQGSGRAGSPRRSASDRPMTLVGNQAGSSSNATGNVHMEIESTPFRRSSMLARTPPKRHGERSIPNIEQEELTNRLTATEAENRDLKRRVLELEEQLKRITESHPEDRGTTNNDGAEVEYFTDEDELLRETEWIVNRESKKRKKMDLSPNILVQPVQQQIGRKEKQSKRKARAPPPVVVIQVVKYDTLYKLLEERQINARTTLVNKRDVKINVDNDENYRKLTALLNEAKAEWYSYENKQTRPIKVVAKYLHQSCKEDCILSDLKNKQYKILEVTNILKQKNKERLPLFMLTFESDENISRIYEIRNILGMKVEIEPLRKSKLIPQCRNCQAFGHTQKYCYKNPRCVKCAGDHHTKECKKEIINKTQLKCVNCNKAHPASYRGCLVAKEAQSRRNNSNKNKTDKTNNLTNKNDKTSKMNLTDKWKLRQPDKTYAQTAMGNNSENLKQQNVGARESSCKSTSEILQEILSRIEKMEEKLTKLEVNSKKGAVPRNQ